MYNPKLSPAYSCSTTLFSQDGETSCMGHIFTTLQQLKDGCLHALSSRLTRWTKPLGTSLPLQTLADLGRSKSELIAENALLRQQLIILKRQVKRPACTKTDRILLVLLARLVRAWQQTLLIVQPDTLLWLPSGALPPVLEAQVKGLFSSAEGSRGNHRLDQADGQRESTLGCRADSWRIVETGHSCVQAHHSEVHEDGSHTPATWPDVGNFSAHSRRTGLGLRRASRSPISSFDRSQAFFLIELQSRKADPCGRDTLSDRCLGGPTTARSHPVWASAEVSDS